jgi:heme oxygenase (biliverdin-IX-beta and delta-forming)
MPRIVYQDRAGLEKLDIPWVSMPSSAMPSLSACLRVHTAPLYRETEVLFGLSRAIRTPTEYITWPGRFLRPHELLERLLAGLAEWNQAGLAPSRSGHAGSLVADLTQFNAGPAQWPRVPLESLPDSPGFAHAVGALYVLEGARLGGRLIPRGVNSRVRAEIVGATRRFGGGESATMRNWQSFGAALRCVGRERPLLHDGVLTGAKSVFQAVLASFASFRAVSACVA